MKIVCSKSSLLNGLQIVTKAVPSKTTMSILECILIDATTDHIKLTANDMELGIETIVNGSIEEKGMIALDAKMLFDIVRKLPDNQITISSDQSFKTNIVCESAKFSLVGKSGEEFSFLPQIEKNNSIILSQFSLKEIIRQTIFSIASNETNKIMTGELFEINDNTFKVVSLDGHRISIRKIELKNTYENKKVIVPGKTLNEISKILKDHTDRDVTISISDKHILFEFDETIVVSRLIEGEFFKIDQMLMNDYETKVIINKKNFLDSIDRSTLFIREKNNSPFIMDVNDNKVEISVNCAIGSMKEEVEIEKKGKDILIGFNPYYLMDALKVIDEDEITLYMVNPKAPCYIKDEKENYTYLILPVNFTKQS